MFKIKSASGREWIGQIIGQYACGTVDGIFKSSVIVAGKYFLRGEKFLIERGVEV